VAAADDKPSKVAQLRARHPWIDHLARAGERYTERHGDHYAAAITFFSVLSLVPLLMVGFAAAGYVLFFNPDLLLQIQNSIKENLPPSIADTLNPAIDQAIAQRNAVLSFGLLTALYSGIGWMSNLREALSEQWAQPPEVPALAKRLLKDLLALAGLGVALLLSFAVTGIVGGFTVQLLQLVGLADAGWARGLLQLISVLLGLAANFLIFLWVIARLPRRHATLRSAAKAALLGAIGFEVLKRVMTVYLATVSGSPSGAAFGGIIGLFVFAFFVSRFILFVTAWAATAKENEQDLVPDVPSPAVIRPEVVVHSGPSAQGAAGLIGAGAVAGVVTGALALLGVRRIGRRS
jgi:membrane protein